MERIEVNKAREYKLTVSCNQSSVKNLTLQTATDIEKTSKKTSFKVRSNGSNLY